MDFETLASGLNCTPPAIDDFPRDFFTEEQRQGGAVVVHIVVSLYLFVALAVVCDKYFVPAVEKICHALNMTADVAGATFMAAATSAPELFVNVIGTFITEGDIGVGTIVGSAVFNILAVAACCGIGAGMSGAKIVPLDWWPLTRDCLAYGVTVSILICIIHDERVEWYEALCLVLLYTVYIFIMYFDKSIQNCVRGLMNLPPIPKSRRSSSKGNPDALDIHFNIKITSGDIHPEKDKTDKKPTEKLKDTGTKNIDFQNNFSDPDDGVYVINSSTHVNGSLKLPMAIEDKGIDHFKKEECVLSNHERSHSLWRWPGESGKLAQATWIITWPIYLIFLFTIPDCEAKRFKKWFPLTFVMCIVWIGSLSYAVAWMITIIGDTLKIPDSVMGITFLAAGTSVPEAVSSVIVAKQGHGSMGISNSIGSNTFDILLCLGLPWFIKATFMPTIAGRHWVGINSAGIEYSAISLLSTLLMLYIAFALNKFQLDKRVGRVCLLMYAVFLTLASLIELNAFFRVNLPTCGR
ncbi:sodium/potassium/calcium exchanger 3 isoform X1 [Diabrotica undecimpunctata]|uniref:sodium/potassium/calcium exchanger 3 isoform X1 n=1 Tax=Diabrotica undecimpunctata TaxID=50387 RepID=UPI003B637101